MKKKIIVLLIVLTALFISSGCVEVTYGFYIKSDGSVEKKYNVVIDENADFGNYNADYALTIAKAQLTEMLEQDSEFGEIIENEDNKYDISLIYSYESLTEYYIALGKTGNDLPEPDDSEIESDLLYQYYTSEVFSDINNEYVSDFCEGMKNVAFPLIATIPYNEIKINLEYGTKYTKAYSSNAQIDYLDNDAKIFKWAMDANDCNDLRLITAKQPNTANWYLFSITLSIVISVIMLLINNRRRKEEDGREQ